ncbi:hypothetical protein BDV96DRAFT_283377 [Lophiotrema nucula]|uniref:Zn(2)-C6 fungal-type domain-containing protein n=1 Tax=Lophiotrema nucula TaxID=690887 RepID=A0A6A5ZNJ0_9PLEO|nr:hypothetical protein BDV96DRAFT_283377 [Lophiotrema nucula]
MSLAADAQEPSAGAKPRRRERVRMRASRACQRCSQRKVQCDGAQGGLPCSRCRADSDASCFFVPSRRGTFARKKNLSRPALATDAPQSHVASIDRLPQPSRIDGTSPADSAAADSASIVGTVASSADAPDTSASVQSTSLASMFEDFLDGQDLSHEDLVGKRGIIFLGDSSPLTFALEELQRGRKPTLYDAGFHLATQTLGSEEGVAAPQQNTHPPHMTSADVAYLRAKGAFEFPKAEVSSALVTAFLERFCPLYSIIDKESFEHLYKEQKLPWILLHVVCFIGTTCCDQDVIHRLHFQSRLHARHMFYEKVKVLFDLGYETDKIVLLQTVLLLTFWGPHMKSYWNPCSWIGFGVTIAESLGIYKSTLSAHLKATDKSLLRRLWWTLVARDAYCAALLGRPFRINMARCDTEMLSVEDFNQSGTSSQAGHAEQGSVEALYQVQIVKLSLILRHIVRSRSDVTCESDTIEMLNGLLNSWQSELPPRVDWRRPCNHADLYATSLKIVFHHHLIVLHLGDPHPISSSLNRGMEQDTPSIQAAEAAAQTISSSAVALMMNAMVTRMPHEVFSGFFMAAIVFYRQLKQPQEIMRQLGQAALDNCQMVLNEARERWDAARWGLRIFDFLLSRRGKADMALDGNWQGSNNLLPSLSSSGEITQPTPGAADTQGHNMLHSTDFASPSLQDPMRNFTDFPFMPNYFMSVPDADFSFQF